MAERGLRTMMYVSRWEYVPDALRSPYKARAFLDENMPRGTQYAGIFHDKDVYTPEDEAKDSTHKAGTPKQGHVHWSFYLPNTKTPTALAKILGVPANTVALFGGPNAKQNVMAYLVHKTEGSKADGKHIYGYDEVISNFDYKAYVEGVGHAIEAARIDKAEIQQQVMDGTLRYIDFIMRDDLTAFYLTHKTFVTTLIDTVYKRRMNDRHEGKVTVLYIEGPAGSGKTEEAKAYAKRNYRDYCISSSHNDSAQDYLGQDVMIFDDARPGDFTASEWLKLLDPYNNECTINSRYYNKYLAVKCIILTSVTPFEEFFIYAPRKESSSLLEPVGQFMRRFDYVLKASRRETADVLYTDVSIHAIQPLKTPVERVVDGKLVQYVHAVDRRPKKVVTTMIGRLHDSGSEALLDTF